MIRMNFLNPPESRQRPFEIGVFELQLGLGQQHRRLGLRQILVGEFQPIVPALVRTLQLRRPAPP